MKLRPDEPQTCLFEEKHFASTSLLSILLIVYVIVIYKLICFRAKRQHYESVCAFTRESSAEKCALTSRIKIRDEKEQCHLCLKAGIFCKAASL